MSPFEISVMRFIFTLDNILVTLMPWLSALAAVLVIVFISLLARRIIRGKASPAR